MIDLTDRDREMLYRKRILLAESEPAMVNAINDYQDWLNENGRPYTASELPFLNAQWVRGRAVLGDRE